jgi:hypothetical protein
VYVRLLKDREGVRRKRGKKARCGKNTERYKNIALQKEIQ